MQKYVRIVQITSLNLSMSTLTGYRRECNMIANDYSSKVINIIHFLFVQCLQLEEHKEQIELIMWDHFEKYRTSKVELETLTQELQKELEKLKATCLINTEKIGYNYQVRITSFNIPILGQKLFSVS